MIKIVHTTRFNKDVETCKSRGWDMSSFVEAYKLLAVGTSLPQKFSDHPLQGNYKGYREFHFGPDHLVIYLIKKPPKQKKKPSKNAVDEAPIETTFVRMGSHSDLF